jgi:chromosome segregation ATPase
MECKEEMIVALLQNISERINNKTLNTNPSASTSLKGDLDFKKDLIKKSVSTLEEAKAQYEALSVKMDRLGTLDETLKKEIKSYKEKLEKCNKDMHEKYERIDFQKEFLKSEEKRMNELFPYLEKNKENYNKLLTSLILKTRSKSTNLEDLDTYKKLRELEKKIQENENYIFSLQSYIDSKAMENDFSHLLKEVMDLQRDINEELIKRNS